METKKNVCAWTGRELPDSLAGYQLVGSTEQRTETVRKDDLLVPPYAMSPADWAWPTRMVGRPIDEKGKADCWRVYRRIPVPHTGDTDVSPTGKTYGELRDNKFEGNVATSATAEYWRKEALAGRPGPGGAALDAEVKKTSALPHDAAERKATPICTGFLDYFPDAIAEVARVSLAGNRQHHPDKPLHWDKSKSTDEADALMRHLLDRGTRDTDGQRHSAKVAWRALALLQREIDAERATTEVK
jgi:hypothetical protein